MLVKKGSGIPLFSKFSSHAPKLFKKGPSYEIVPSLNSLVNSSEKNVKRIEKAKSKY